MQVVHHHASTYEDIYWVLNLVKHFQYPHSVSKSELTTSVASTMVRLQYIQVLPKRRTRPMPAAYSLLYCVKHSFLGLGYHHR